MKTSARNLSLWGLLFTAAGFSGLILVALFGGTRYLRAAGLSRAQSSSADAQVARGRYLVDNVAMCSECHTPRDDSGNLEPNAYLQGASVWIEPVHKIPDWADRAPALAGLGGFTEQQIERVLEQGTGPEGEVLRPPMHIYHMAPQDANAIVAYLKSIPGTKH